jgi:hypothetical protein
MSNTSPGIERRRRVLACSEGQVHAQLHSALENICKKSLSEPEHLL